MIESIFKILGILGSLGVFLFGMKVMSDALQKTAGILVRSQESVDAASQSLIATTSLIQVRTSLFQRIDFDGTIKNRSDIDGLFCHDNTPL